MSQRGSDVLSIVERYFEVKDFTEVESNVYRMQVIGVKEGSLASSFRALYRELVRTGHAPLIRREGSALYLIVSSYSRRFNFVTWIVLAAFTVLSVYYSGYALMRLPSGGALTPLFYTVGLLAPLLIHEMGHWVTMRRYGVPRSPPYLIPAPPLQLGFLGTLGAVINMKWVPATADELALIGVSGPLAGFIAGVPLAIVGLKTSALMPASSVPPSSTISAVPVIMYLLLATIHAPAGYDVVVSPLALAAYIVFFVTFLNLIPVGQLDGGHVIRAALGVKGHMVVSFVFILVLLSLGVYMPTLGLFGIIALAIFLLTRGRHPGPAIEQSRLGKVGIVAVIIYGVLLALTMPIPS
ncbi:MAG: site-2 protease family protein [Acidilobus sp.]